MWAWRIVPIFGVFAIVYGNDALFKWFLVTSVALIGGMFFWIIDDLDILEAELDEVGDQTDILVRQNLDVPLNEIKKRIDKLGTHT